MNFKQTTTERNYKATFILDTRELEEQLETLVEKLKNILSQLTNAWYLHEYKISIINFEV